MEELKNLPDFVDWLFLSGQGLQVETELVFQHNS